ncbi:MAG TPA: alpha/beta hydrolase [Candidatus Acidoferrales bacterium]|nr:alpha/beta hydrolase [Candidatus Acidoferrales bacterium]
MSTFVLVHGAWHGGWCWNRVADRLRARGHRVFAPTLTGLGERSHLLAKDVGLSTHVDDVVNVIRWEGLDGITLVGHSYGGVVISAVAEKAGANIASLVFLDAFIPEDGESMLDVTHSRTSQRWEESLKASGGLSIAPIPASVFKVNDADRAWVDAQCGPHPYKTFVDTVSLSGARDRIEKKAYIRAALYDSVPFRAYYERVKADPAWQTFEVQSGHDVMLDAPDELVRILENVA